MESTFFIWWKVPLSQLYISVSQSARFRLDCFFKHICVLVEYCLLFLFYFPWNIVGNCTCVYCHLAQCSSAAVHNRTDVFDSGRWCSASSKLVNKLQGHIYITPTGGNRPHSRGLVLFIRLAVTKYGTTTSGQRTMSLTHCWQLISCIKLSLEQAAYWWWPSDRSCRCCCWDDVVFQSSLGNTSQWTVFFSFVVILFSFL